MPPNITEMYSSSQNIVQSGIYTCTCIYIYGELIHGLLLLMAQRCDQAANHIHLGHTDTEGRWSVFGQAFRQVC